MAFVLTWASSWYIVYVSGVEEKEELPLAPYHSSSVKMRPCFAIWRVRLIISRSNVHGERLLTKQEFQKLAEVPALLEWFANLKNERTKRAFGLATPRRNPSAVPTPRGKSLRATIAAITPSVNLENKE
jgi:hypothetical protein